MRTQPNYSHRSFAPSPPGASCRRLCLARCDELQQCLHKDDEDPEDSSTSSSTLAGHVGPLAFWKVSTLILLIALVGVGARELFQKRADSVRVTQFLVYPPDRGAFESGIGGADDWPFPTLSPDGLHLAFTARDSSRRTMLWVRLLTQRLPWRCPGRKAPALLSGLPTVVRLHSSRKASSRESMLQEAQYETYVTRHWLHAVAHGIATATFCLHRRMLDHSIASRRAVATQWLRQSPPKDKMFTECPLSFRMAGTSCSSRKAKRCPWIVCGDAGFKTCHALFIGDGFGRVVFPAGTPVVYAGRHPLLSAFRCAQARSQRRTETRDRADRVFRESKSVFRLRQRGSGILVWCCDR